MIDLFGIALWVCVGLVLGWFVLPQPAWAKAAWDKVKGWFA